jgi:small subunit ribosomal protein S17
MTMSEQEKRGNRKIRDGVVVSDKMDKTIVVRVERRTRHPLYGKEIRSSRKFYAHDEENRAQVGDRVRITETRPLSKNKNWRLLDVL